jgi:hypothetical protein
MDCFAQNIHLKFCIGRVPSAEGHQQIALRAGDGALRPDGQAPLRDQRDNRHLRAEGDSGQTLGRGLAESDPGMKSMWVRDGRSNAVSGRSNGFSNA